jgi:hypothetical protein
MINNIIKKELIFSMAKVKKDFSQVTFKWESLVKQELQG